MKATVRDLGVIGYAACWALQQRLFEGLLENKRRPEQASEGAEKANKGAGKASEGAGKANEGAGTTKNLEAGTILLAGHPPVYTLGKSGHAENLLVDRATLEQLGAEFFHIDRGGDITFHGPGQLVCYPILDLERLGIGLRTYIERLEEAVIRTVAEYGIAAGRIAGASGVWITQELQNETKRGLNERRDEGAAQKGGPRKICAIGVRSSRYVTMHGFALNVATDLEWFSRINPCGFRDRGVTSILRETGREVPMDEVKARLIRRLGEQLGLETGGKE